MSPARLLVVVLLLAVAAAGCTKVHAKTEPEMPLLTPPPPPPRIIEPYADDVTPPPPPPPDTTQADTPPEPPPAKPPAPRVDTTTKPEVPRNEPEPERPPPPPPTLTLKPAAGTESTTESSIRALISRASRALSRVNYTSLNSDGKAQYDTARRFMQQAEEAMRSGNLVFAGKLADKSATMASVLVR